VIPLREGIAEPPTALLELARAAGRSNGNSRTPRSAAGQRIRNGQRNATLTSLAGSMRRNNMSEAEMRAALLVTNRDRCDPPLADEEVARIAASVARYEPAPSASNHAEAFHLTDLGNAKRLVRLHGADLRFCHSWRRWLTWDGKRWAKDDTAEVLRRAKDAVFAIYQDVASIRGEANDDKARRQALTKHAVRSEADARIKGQLSLAESEPGIPVTPEQLDTDAYLLNCENGTLDLRTSTLQPHNRTHLITKLVPVAYNPSARAPGSEAFLGRVMAEHQDLIAFLQRAVGSALTADASDQVIFILYGSGANGKSVFLKTVAGLLGDYACWTPAETFLPKQSDAIRNDLARLRGLRFVASTETDEGAKLAESTVKRITGDIVTARFLHQEFFDFTPTFKVFLGVNHRPTVRGSDHAIWRRIRLVPFTIRIPDDEQDPYLADALKVELPGILNWALVGCAAWQRAGLNTPEVVRTATQGYRADEDILAAYLEECGEIGEGRSTAAAALYTSYTTWAKAAGEPPMSKKALGTRLRERGFTARPTHAGRTWFGVGLRSTGEADPNA
jgi:putative DNA primase/helicase